MIHYIEDMKRLHRMIRNSQELQDYLMGHIERMTASHNESEIYTCGEVALLKTQLHLAVNALNDIASGDQCYHPVSRAQQAMQKIEALKNN